MAGNITTTIIVSIDAWLNFIVCIFYAEITNVKSSGKNMGKGYYMRNGNSPQVERIYVPMELQKEVSLPFCSCT